MKRVPKSQPEPTCLTAFRQGSPDSTWEEFKNTTCSQTVLNQTVNDQGGLCAYCERCLDRHDRQIAHFHPKSDRPAAVNWGLHWPNLWLACQGGDQTWMTDPDAYLAPATENRSCDVAKENDKVEGKVIAPDQVPAFPRIFAYRQSTDRLDIVADESLCQQAGIAPALADQTISTFNLNCRRLAEARMRIHSKLEKKIKEIRLLGPRGRNLWESLALHHLARSTDGRWKPFFTMVRWRFGDTAETYLHSISYQG